jgi:hypothetical protein
MTTERNYCGTTRFELDLIFMEIQLISVVCRTDEEGIIVKNQPIISEERALEIVNEFLAEIRAIDNDGIIALYVIGSLGGGYYRPGQSDIDTVIIVRDDAHITEQQCDEIADKYC